MENFIQTFINGYNYPAFLSDAGRGEILFANEAVHTKLGLSEKQLADMSLSDLFKTNKIICEQLVFEHKNNSYLVQNEAFTFSGTDYIKSVLQPYQQNAVRSHIDFQKEMAGRLVHRLRSPVNGVSGFAELLGQTPLKDKQREYLLAINDGLNDLKSILSKIEVLSKPITIYETEVNVEVLAEQILADYSKSERRRIRVQIDKEVKSYRTDFSLLKMIIQELVTNAFQHGNDSPASISLCFLKDRIRVHNSGTPIPEALREKIFYPFFSSKARHIGIGLAKSVNYAEELGLELKLTQNSVDKGIRFDILF